VKPTEQRRQEAQARQQAYQQLTPQQRLAALDKALGPGLGAKKERARLTGKPQALRDFNAKAILSAFQMSPEQLGEAAVRQAAKGKKA